MDEEVQTTVDAVGDLCLRFADEAEANEVLEGYTGNVDVIGVIFKPTGKMLKSKDEAYPEMKAVSGWHVNTRGPMLPELKMYSVEVNSPVRVWA